MSDSPSAVWARARVSHGRRLALGLGLFGGGPQARRVSESFKFGIHITVDSPTASVTVTFAFVQPCTTQWPVTQTMVAATWLCHDGLGLFCHFWSDMAQWPGPPGA